MIKIETSVFEHSSEPRILGVKIYQEENGAYAFTVRHSGSFSLGDFKELDLEVTSARLVKRNQRPIMPAIEKTLQV